MKVLIITDGLFNNYARLNEMAFEDDELYIFVSPEDKNKMDTYFKENYKGVTIIKQKTDIPFEKIIVLRIHDKSETPYETLKPHLTNIDAEYFNSPQLSRFKNFRDVKLQTIENTYKDMGVTNREKKVKDRVKQRIRKMKSRAKTKTNAKPKKDTKSIVRVSLKMPPNVSQGLVLETYD